jgi:hypothetical protein
MNQLQGQATSGNFIQNSSELDYFYGLLATAPESHIENNQPLVHRALETKIRSFVASLALGEAIPTPRSGHFIQNASKLCYFYGLVAAAPGNHIENPAASLWLCRIEVVGSSHETIGIAGLHTRGQAELPLACVTNGNRILASHGLKHSTKWTQTSVLNVNPHFHDLLTVLPPLEIHRGWDFLTISLQ